MFARVFEAVMISLGVAIALATILIGPEPVFFPEENGVYMKAVKLIGGSILGLLLVFGIGFGLKYVGVLSYEFFGKAYTSADREIFEESKPFIHGSIQNLYKMKMEYETADTEQHRRAIRSAVFAQTSGLDKSHLPADLQAWMQSLSVSPVSSTTSVTHQ